MKKVLLSLAVVGLLLFAVSLAAFAAAPVTPTVTAIEPTSAFNDIGTRVTITGADFALETTDAVEPPGTVATTTPGVSLGNTPLTDVTWVDTQTLTATVPWGMDPGVYPLTVINSSGGASSLLDAFTVTQGINTWNAGELNGAAVRELRTKPGDPNTLYALAYDVGVFRSRDGGDSWAFTSANVIANAVFTVDPNPGHESWLYSAMNSGVYVSKDEGDSWRLLPDPARDEVIRSAQVFVSPRTAGTLFVGYYGSETPASLLGLRKSTDAGAHWTSVHRFDGIPVQAVAFNPAPDSHEMVLVTSDARVFKSPDEGLTWSPVVTPPLTDGMGSTGSITYNPYKTSEVWIYSTEVQGGMFKSSDADITSWIDVTPWDHSGYPVTFTGPDDAYVWHAHSANGGATWDAFGPWPTWGDGEVVFDPEDTQTVYVTNSTVGVQKSTDGGAHWNDANKGLAGMRCNTMSVSRTDPLRVYAAFNGWGGVYRSDDGTSHWDYVPIEGSGQVGQVLEDPFQDGRLYAAADGGFYTSTDGGRTWPGESWDSLLPPGSTRGMMNALAADPHHPGHLLVADRVGMGDTHDHDEGFLFSSTDYGATWSSVVVSAPIDSLAYISGITFDPDETDTVYLTTGGSGVYRSSDNGDTWKRIDDRKQRLMASGYGISVATHPQHVLLVSADSGRPFRSFDEGKTWENKQNSGEVSANLYVFINGDSTRLYAPDWTGLHFSSNLGDSWTTAAGALGSIQVTTLAYADADGHTILYAATTGGKNAPVPASAQALPSATMRSEAALAATPRSDLVGAGIYRRAQIETVRTHRSSSSRDGWTLESREHSGSGGTTSAGASTVRLGDNAAKKQYRSILSFGTGDGLPDAAVITKVELRVKSNGVTGGGDPVTAFGGFVVDLKKGYFGTGSTLRASDFQAAASKTYGPFKPTLTAGWYSIDLTAAKAYVNKSSARSGVTQVRLRFKRDDDNNGRANYLRLYSGDASTGSRPQLIVDYYMP